MDQLASDPAERVGVVAAKVPRRPVGPLRGDGSADRLLVGQIVEREPEIDCGKARLFGQRLAHGNRAFPMGGEFGPDGGDRFVISEQALRDGDSAGHAGQALGQRIDQRDVVALPFMGFGLVLPAALQIDHDLATMDDRASRPERGLRLDRGSEGIGDRLEPGGDLPAHPECTHRASRIMVNNCPLFFLHRRPPHCASAKTANALSAGASGNWLRSDWLVPRSEDMVERVPLISHGLILRAAHAKRGP